MLDMLEKLINEHGSSTILRERLELFSDKYSMLKDKNKHLIESVMELETKLNQANEEVARLSGIVESSKKTDTPDELKEIELQILKYFFDTNQQLLADHISREIGIAVGNAEYHINKLLEIGFLHDLLTVGEPIRYQINASGRAFIIEST